MTDQIPFGTDSFEKNPILRRKSMELLKDLTQILQEIIGSGDEESLSSVGRNNPRDR